MMMVSSRRQWARCWKRTVLVGVLAVFTRVSSFVPIHLRRSVMLPKLGQTNHDDCEDNDEKVNDFFFQSNQANLQSNHQANRIFMDTKMVSSPKIVVLDWECLLDALPYHVELGIHAARKVWPHLNDLCNFDTDRQWLENKLFAMAHVLSSPEGPSGHVSCEFALATRLILEEQALDRNESTGKNGKYSRKFHPRAEINGSEQFRPSGGSRRPLTAGELAVNWREFIRSTLLVKYSYPLSELEECIRDFDSRSLSLFPNTKFALRNSSAKIVVRISHPLDNEIVTKSLHPQLGILPKTYTPEHAISKLCEENNNNMVLLLGAEHSEKKCLKTIMKESLVYHPKTPPSILWVDSSWHRLQGLAPLFGDSIPSSKENVAMCALGQSQFCWLSLYLAEWPSVDDATHHEAAMVYPWTDSLSWETAEDILIPTSWGSSDTTAFQ